jgi:hypothetical protein
MRDLKVIDGGRNEDLVTALLRAIDLAKSSRSGTTVYLLKMALLNEGILLASDLSRKGAFPAAQKGLSPASRPNFVDAERPKGCQLPSLRSARREVVRPRS